MMAFKEIFHRDSHGITVPLDKPRSNDAHTVRGIEYSLIGRRSEMARFRNSKSFDWPSVIFEGLQFA